LWTEGKEVMDDIDKKWKEADDILNEAFDNVLGLEVSEEKKEE
jgi:GTP-sensing pleiotropic transcriptional regulator CodY